MSFWSRVLKGGAASILTGSMSGGMAAAMTDNFGIGVSAGVASRMLGNFGFGGCNAAWGGGFGYGGWGGGNAWGSSYPGYGFSNAMYNMSYNNFYDQIAWSNNTRWY